VTDFRSYLTELFENPFALKSVRRGNALVSYLYQIDPQLEPQNSEENRNNLVTVNFALMNVEENEWDVDFVRGGSTALTGKGDAGRVFATVLSAIQDFTKAYKPNTLLFTAAKNELRVSDLSYRSGSRVKLYSAMVKRFAPKLGYKLVDAKDVGSVKHLFVLQRVNP